MLFLLAPLTLSLLQPAAQDTRPLPDRTTFLIEFQVKRPGLYRLMGSMADVNAESQYTYTETTTEVSLDSKGNTKGTKRQVVEYIPTSLPGYIYERQVVKDGVPLTAKELEKQDKEVQEDLAKIVARREKWNADAPKRAEEAKKRTDEIRKQFEKDLAKNLDKEKLTGEARRVREQREREDFEKMISGANKPPVTMDSSSVLRAADFQLVRRETLDGYSTIVLSFKANPKFKGPQGDMEKILQHTVGRVWVNEADYQPVKIELEIADSINFGLGLLAKVQPGTRATFEWRKINNEVWLPYKREFTAKIRILLVKGEHMREINEYSNHKKYVVSSEVKFQGGR